MFRYLRFVTLAPLFAATLLVSAAWAAKVGDTAPAISSTQWLNGPAPTSAQLAGKVVLVEFWTFGCWNCRNIEPYVKQWHDRYKSQGFTVVGVHTPEFDREKNVENVKAYVRKQSISYPVALDNDHANWNRYANQYWPAFYLRDRHGTIRYVHFGEGRYDETEAMIRKLIAER